MDGSFYCGGPEDVEGLTAAILEKPSDSFIATTSSVGDNTIASAISNTIASSTDVERGKEDETQDPKPFHTPTSTRKTHKRLLEVCINTGDYQKTLAEIDLTNCASDGEMFSRIRNAYSRVRKFQVKAVFLQPVEVHFVQVS